MESYFLFQFSLFTVHCSLFTVFAVPLCLFLPCRLQGEKTSDTASPKSNSHAAAAA